MTTYAPPKRALQQPNRPENAAAIRQLITAIGELSGGFGSRMDRAVRMGDLVQAGLLKFDTGGELIVSDATLTGNIELVGDKRRIRGDMSNADFNKRLSFETSIPNSPTVINAAPAGSSQISGMRVFNRSDMMNAAYMTMYVDNTRSALMGGKTGTGTALDLTVELNGSELQRWIAASSVIEFPTLGTAPAGSKIQLGSPNAVPGIVGFHGGTRRRDIRFAGTSIELGASTTTASPATALRINEDLSIDVPTGPLVAGANGTNGYVKLVTGTASNPGYIGYYTADNTRRGYVGWSTGSNLLFTAEAGYNWAFNVTGGHAGTDWPTIGTGLIGLLNLGRGTTALVQGQMFATAAGFTLNTGFAPGTTYYVYNNSNAAITITSGAGLTLRLSGTATVGNRTLAGRGMVMIWANATNDYNIVNLGGLT